MIFGVCNTWVNLDAISRGVTTVLIGGGVYSYIRVSQGATGNFIYLLEGQIHFALKLSVGCSI